ncbi:MAG: hypothetical protein ACOYOH_09545 [Paracraurococcus sp.]|jgi:hypothetical protein
MSSTTADLRAVSAHRPAFGAALSGQLRRWLRQRRQAAVLCHVDPRLCEDAGMPVSQARGSVAAASRLLVMRAG